MQEISLDGYQTMKPPVLFYHDPLKCVQVLLQNPTFEGKWLFVARRIYEDANRQNHVYSDWMSGDGAWSAQVSTVLTSSFTPLLSGPLYPMLSMCFEGAQLTQLVQLVTASRLFLGHKGQIDL